MRRLGIALAVLIVLVVLALVAAWVALQRIDWNEYKAPIAQAAFDATGRQLDLSGDIHLEIGLQPGVSVAGIGFQNAAWGSRPQMATVERFVVRLELWPLLSGNIVVSRVELVGLDLLLETNAKGVPNWEFTPPPGARSAEGEASKPAPSPPGGEEKKEKAAPYSAIVRRAEIENAVVVIRDDRSGATKRFAIERLLAVSEGERGPLRLDLAARYGDAPIEVTGTVDGLPDVMAGAALGIDLAIQAGGAKVDVAGRVGKPLEGSDLDLTVGVAGKRLAELGAVTGGELPDLGPYRLDLKVTGGGDAYTIRDLALQLGSTALAGSVDVKLGGARPRVDARMTSPHIALADFQDAKAAKAAKASGGSSASAASAGTGGSGSSAAGGQRRVFSADPLPLDGLSAADAVLRLQAKEIDLGTLLLTGFDLDLKLENRNLQVKKLASDVAGGHLDLALSLDAAKKPPPLVVKAQARAVDLGKLLHAQGNDMLSGGPLDVDVDLTGRGGSVRDIMASLDGSLVLQMGTATLSDDTAALVLADAASLLRVDAAKQARISCAFADVPVSDGIARADGIVVDLASIALFGDGKIDLRDEKLKLKFDRQAVSVSVADALPPFSVKGTFAEPKAGVDAGALATRALDLGATLLEGKKKKKGAPAAARPSGCRELLADYRREIQERGSSADVAGRAVDALGEKTGKTGKKVLDSVKGLFGR